MGSIPVNEPLLDGNEAKYLQECIRTGWISSEGPFVAEFEKKFAARVGRKHGIAYCNGTATLEAALVALRLEPGSEVILPSFTIISCIAAVIRAGLTPVVVDSDPVTWNMDIAQVRAAITSRTRALMPVHIYGLPVDMDPLLALAREHKLKIVEDAAEQIGQTYKGKPCGSFGDISSFSFYPNKHITTGEGGMLVTDSDELAERCRSLRNLCFQPKQRFVHEELGYNFRMTNLQAALGLAQLERLDQFIEKKRQVGRQYDALFAELSDIVEVQPPRTDYAESIYWVYGLVLKEKFPRDAAWCMKMLAEKGIGTRPFFFPMHEQPVFRGQYGFDGLKLPVAERISRRGFYVPSGLALTTEQINQVAKEVKALVRGNQ